MDPPLVFQCVSLADTQNAAAEITVLLDFPACVYLHGGLGAGKTTMCQSIIAALGYPGTVTSPTYNLIQEYPLEQGTIYHIDLYRLEEPAELEFLGLTDLIGEQSLFLIEWPRKGEPMLLPATHEITIEKQIDNGVSSREIRFVESQN